MTKCYICNNVGTTLEHVPPKCIFPESKDLESGLDLRKNLIKVPSCDEHNLRKSGDDEYILYILVSNININAFALTQWRTKIQRSMAKRPSKKGIYKNLQPTVYQGISTGMYEIDFERVTRQFEQISRGIYYHNFEKHWPDDVQIAFTFAISTNSNEGIEYSKTMAELVFLAKSFLTDEPKQGDNPEIFYYQHKKADLTGYIIRMVFYGGIDVVAIFRSKNDFPSANVY